MVSVEVISTFIFVLEGTIVLHIFGCIFATFEYCVVRKCVLSERNVYETTSPKGVRRLKKLDRLLGLGEIPGSGSSGILLMV